MFKRISVFLLSFIIIVSSAFSISTAAAETAYKTGAYRVTAYGGVKLYETYEPSFDFKTVAVRDACLNIIRVNGDFGYTVFDSVFGWVDLSDGLEYISSYPSITDSGRIEGTKGIKITHMPDKLLYTEGEESADISGLEVSVIFNDEQESAMPVTGYTVSFPSLDVFGGKTVRVYYAGFTASFPITVRKVPVTGIVLTLPSKTSYVEGEAVSFEGLKVTAYYSDGRDSGAGIELNPEEYTIEGVKEGDTSLSPGTYTVTVTYKYPEISASFHIYVSGKSVSSLRLLRLPANPTIYQGQSFNKEDFELSATYDNGVTETITDFDIEYDNMQTGIHTARIYYMDKYVAFDYNVLELKETGIELGDTSSVGSYAGSEISFKNLTVYLVYNSGEKKPIDGYTLDYDIDINTIGKYPVTVYYGDYSASFDYTVAERRDITAGDVNFDGTIDAADARLALRYSAKIENLSDAAAAAADVNLDNEVNAADARKILRVSAKIDRF